MNQGIDTFLEILKFVGLVITGAMGLVGFFTTKIWEEYEKPQTIIVPGRPPTIGRQLTQWGKTSLVLLIVSGLVTLIAQLVETGRTNEKERQAAKEKQKERELAAKEKADDRERFAREKEEDRRVFDKRLGEERQRYEAATAELLLQRIEVDRQRAQLIERARDSNISLSLPEIAAIPTANIDQAIQTALQAIPAEVRAAAEQRNQEEAERLAAQVRAREIDRQVRPRVSYMFDLLRSVVVESQRKGLVTVTNLGPAPILPERIVYSQQETNVSGYSARLGDNIFRTTVRQRIDFAHGDSWTAYLVVGVVQSSTATNELIYPKLKIRNNEGIKGLIWIDPASAELNFTPGSGNDLPGPVRRSENAVITNLVELLKQSRLKNARER